MLVFFSKRYSKVIDYDGRGFGEDISGVEKWETIMRVYSMKYNLYSKR